ncbi:MAG: hypothetical protein WB792_09775 [Desulfobacterales bacterium]
MKIASSPIGCSGRRGEGPPACGGRNTEAKESVDAQKSGLPTDVADELIPEK